VSKGDVVKCCKSGANSIGDVKTQTKAGSGCGGCMGLVTSIFNAEMKKAGLTVSSDICSHFKMSRQDLFQVIKCAPPVPRRLDKIY
jgi:nitrite reductase (NAD(P)H)